MEPNTLEGSPTLSKDMANLTANVLVYDNHVEVARQFKVSGHRLAQQCGTENHIRYFVLIVNPMV